MQDKSSAIALSDFGNGTETKITKGAVLRAFNNNTILLLRILFVLWVIGCQSMAFATTITNTATVNYDLGTSSASVIVNSTIRTTSIIELYQYAPGSASAVNFTVPVTQYSTNGTNIGPFANSPIPKDVYGANIPVPGTLKLVPATALKYGEPLLIRIVDPDQNTDPSIADTLLISVGSSLSGDTVLLRVTETAPNSGEFIGYIQTNNGSVTANDPLLTVNIDDQLTVTYTDASDNTDTATTSVLVDPYGQVFSTSDGAALNGANIALVDVTTGNPAIVYGDDGVSIFPATVTSGGSVTDSGGNTYNFPAGRYRFPYILPGTYQLYVIPPGGFNHPSTASLAAIQALPGAPYSIVVGSRGENFVVNPGPALHIDIPLDPSNSVLFVTKRATKSKVAIGDFVGYTLTLENTSSGGLTNTVLTDRLPVGFRLKPGSVKINNVAATDPTISKDGRTLSFNIGNLAATTTVSINYVAAVSASARIGNAVNRAYATALGGITSNKVSASVMVDDELTQSHSFIMGRVILGGCDVETAAKGNVSLQLQSEAVTDEVHYTATLHVNTVPVNELQLVVNLPEVLEYRTGSTQMGDRAAADPKIFHNQLTFALGNAMPDATYQLHFATRARASVYGEFTASADARFKINLSTDTTLNKEIMLYSPLVENKFKDVPRSYRVRFDTLSAELSEADQANLTDMAYLLRNQVIKRVSIIGYADKRKIIAASDSKFKDNNELSLARADVVAQFIKQKFALTDDQIVTTGQGASHPIYYSEKLQGNKFNEQEQLSFNRRVEVFIELTDQLTDTRFIVSKADSGTQLVSTQGPDGKILGPSARTDFDGVKGIRVYLEDGRFVDTDQNGLFHFEGVRPGTHVVQVDQDSIPDQYEIYQCDNNTRFAGTPYSQFVDIQAGGMWRADFYVRSRPASANRGRVSIQLNSQLNNDQVNFKVDLSGQSIAFKNRTVLIDIPAGLQYEHNSAHLNGNQISNPRLENGKLAFDLGDASAEHWSLSLTFSTAAKLRIDGEYTTSALLRFDTTDGLQQTSSQVTTSLLLQRETQERHVFEANYSGFDTDMSKSDRDDLDSVIDYLMNKRIRTIRIIGHSDNSTIPVHLSRNYPDQYALSLERSTKVGSYLARKLNLYSKQLEIIGKGSTEPVASNDTAASRLANNRTDVYVTFADTNAHQTISINKPDSGKMDTLVSSQLGIKSDKTDNSKDTTEPTISQQGILSLNEGDVVSDPIKLIKIQLDNRLIPELIVDGVKIPDNRIGFTADSKATSLKVYTYIGVNLGTPGSHIMTLNGVDPFGNARFTQEIRYEVAGEIANIRLLDSEGNIADGKTPVRIRIEPIDKDGKPVHTDLELALSGGNLKPPATSDMLPELRNRKVIKLNKDGYLEFAPVASSGTYTANLSYGSIQIDVSTFVKPKFRDWIMVGLAEGTVGYNNVSGNMENLQAADIKDEYYHDGRLAFYAKGKIKGKYLLTTAYDSAKEKPDVSGNGLLGSIQPDKYYTIYGDNTQVGYDAASTEKLYMKLESEEFYALYGDYETGLTVTELSKYNRSFTGLKSEYHSNHVTVNAFATETKQAFIKDELQGDGTSGLYYLSHHNIVLNSDKVTIETRDRFKSEVILEARKLSRYIDYTLDPVSGTLYFKEPIYSRDINFNPVYIVVDYEVEGNVDDNITAGGRVSYKTSHTGPELGATAIQEGTAGAKTELYGVDMNYDYSKNTNIKLELATSNKTDAGQKLQGDAVLAQVTHQKGVINSKLYYREQEPEFGLGQQSGSESGTRKYGAEVQSHIKSNMSLNAEYLHQNNTNTDAQRDVLQSDLEVKQDKYTAKGGFVIARDEFANGEKRDSNLLKGSLQRNFMDGRLKGTAGAEIGADNGNTDYPDRYLLGAEFLLTQKTQLFAQQEFTFGEKEDTQMTRAGVRATPWDNAKLYSSVENQSNEYGPRTFANMGLTQGFELNQFWRLDFGFERSHTLRDSGSAPFNVNVPPSSGTANGGDFTALSAGATYKNNNWSMTSRVETRQGDLEDKVAVLVGVYHEPRPGSGLSARLQYFNTDRSNNTSNEQSQLEFSLAHRPLASRWIILDRIRFLHNEDVGLDVVTTAKLINNFNTDYLIDHWNQLALHHGIKYTKDELDGDSFSSVTQVLGTEYRHDINPYWDIGLQVSGLFTTAANSSKYSYGASIGHSFVDNVWLSLGFNIDGFIDDDFSDAGYTAKGIYLKFRFAFDHYTSRKVMAWWEN